MESLSVDEVKAFLRAVDRSTPEGRRDYALIMTSIHMGLRKSETLSIKTDQFKTSDGKAYVVFRSKGERERAVTVNRDLEVALAAWAHDRGDAPGYLFPGREPGTHLCGDQFWRICRKYLEAAGIKKKVGTHGLRATFITMNVDAGTPLSEIQRTVGHAKAETTLGYARDLEAIKSRAPRVMEGLNTD
jgi:integrase/recombinase XerD